MSVQLSDKAVFRLRTFIRANPDESSAQKGVRLAAVDGGCNGFEYSLNIVDTPEADDIVYEQDKLKIYLDRKSAPFLNGIAIDFVESLTQAGFTFENPNATDSCGCGKSFSVADCPSS